MCGIVGYVGDKMALPFLLDGLAKLEYRGYDSAGVCLNEFGRLIVEKSAGELKNLKSVLKGQTFGSMCGIGHTRWATHGGPETRNAHPQTNFDGTIAVVHNGIIENFEILKKDIDAKCLVSSTDTEVFAHLLSNVVFENSSKQDVIKAIINVTAKIKGTYAFAIMLARFKDCIFLAKRTSPLLIGVGINQNFVASDLSAFLKHTNKVVYLKDNEVACITKSEIYVFDEFGKNIPFDIINEDVSNKNNLLDGFDCYMSKEIEQDSDAVLNTTNSLFCKKFHKKIPKRVLNNVNNIHICACGTAMHAGLYAKFLFEKYLKKDVVCDVASEFRYKTVIGKRNSLCIFISQSGETADTIEGLKKAKQLGGFCVAITNVEKSRIATFADLVVYTKAGPEIAVASTKAYMAQVAAIIWVLCCLLKNDKHKKFLQKSIKNVSKVLKKQKINDFMRKIVKEIAAKRSIFFVGRSIDYFVAMEGALKLKEVSYIHCEAFAAGELKHGSLALIEKDSIVIVILTQKHILEKTMNAVYEIKARGGKIVLISQFCFLKDKVDFFIKLESGTCEDFTPLLAVKVLQQLALLTAKQKDINPDKPRNLAKAVTVE